MSQFRTSALFFYLSALIAAQVITGLCLMGGIHFGKVPEPAFMGLFFGLNLPTIILSGGKRSGAGVFSPGFVAIMVLILLNFLRAGATSGGINDLCGLLHILTAQSLWIAYPAYRASRL